MDVGQTHSEHIEITKQLVSDFAKISGDYNPIHLDDEYARTTPFKKTIAHGLLSSALLSGIMGTRFPGRGTVLLETQMNFRRPVFVGDRIEFRLTVESVRPDKPIVTVLTQIFDSGGALTSEGRTVLKLPLELSAP